MASAVTAPLLAASLIGASYADRHDRRRLMIGADLLRMILLAGLGAALLHGRLQRPVRARHGVAGQREAIPGRVVSPVAAAASYGGLLGCELCERSNARRTDLASEYPSLPASTAVSAAPV